MVQLPRERCRVGLGFSVSTGKENGMRHQPSTRLAGLRRFAIALFAASTVAVGTLAAPTAASAMPMSCAVRYQLSRSYYATGQVFYALGDYTTAFYWVGKSYGIIEGC
jgi:hypothetical protein